MAGSLSGVRVIDSFDYVNPQALALLTGFGAQDL